MSGRGTDLSLLERARVAAATGATMTIDGAEMYRLLRASDLAVQTAKARQEDLTRQQGREAKVRQLHAQARDLCTMGEALYRRVTMVMLGAFLFMLAGLTFFVLGLVL